MKRKIKDYYRVEDGIIRLNKRTANGVPFNEWNFIKEARELEELLKQREQQLKK